LSTPLPGHDDEAPSPGQWSDGTTPPPAGRLRGGRDRADRELVGGDEIGSGDDDAGRRRLPLLLLLVLVLLGGAYLVWSQLLQGDSDDTTTAPPVRASASASAAASPSTTVPRALSPAELAASLQDPHFKHGYDWGKNHGPAPVAEREQLCRTEALSERAGGYPWGAHDRAGCLVALAS
jgi:hypothetical protein